MTGLRNKSQELGKLKKLGVRGVKEVLAKASGRAERKPLPLLIIGGRASRSTTPSRQFIIHNS